MRTLVTVGNVASGDRDTIRVRGTGEALAESLDLSAGTGLRNVVVAHERLLPGRRASSAHFHTTREELVFVLRGAPTLVLDGEARRLAPGDYVGFPAGVPRSHFLRNDSDEDAEYLVVATNEAGDEVVYPR